LQLDSQPPSLPLAKYLYNEARYTMLVHSDPETAKTLLSAAEEDVKARWSQYQRLAGMSGNGETQETSTCPT